MSNGGVGTGESELHLIRASIAALKLDLTGLTVFTEAATGHFRCTPIIALLAGARRVFAIAKDSRYGTCGEARKAVIALARVADVGAGLDIVDDRDSIGDADIVTNTGFVRPISADLAARMRANAVVPLMWETWELRIAELDLAACLERDILVLGTNERDARLRTIDDVGQVAAKLLSMTNVPVQNAEVVIAGGGAFASAATRCIRSLGARVTVFSQWALESDVERFRIDASLGSAAARALFRRASALVVVDHHSDHVLIGEDGDLSPRDLHVANPRLAVVHLSGLCDVLALRTLGITVVPDVIATAPRTMSVTTALLGPRPVIALHTAGLKVGEIMARARQETTSLEAARDAALQDALCQDFSPRQYELARPRRAG